MPPAPVAPRSIGVTVDLEPHPEAGGHVRCWRQLAGALLPEDGVELTVHLLAPRDHPAGAREPLGPAAVALLHPAVLHSARLGFLSGSPDHTDLAPHHRRAAPYLSRHDVLHTTGAHFALARTAERLARRLGRPLVSSTHTDVARYAELFTRTAISRALGDGALSRLLSERLHLGELTARVMRRRLQRHLARCDRVLSSNPEEEAWLDRLLPGRVRRLRRGVRKEQFHPSARDRPRLEAELGIPRGALVLLFVGRLDAAKSPSLLARAARAVADGGTELCVVFVGRGDGADLEATLGGRARITGPLPQEDLPRIYASADLFVFPSSTEVCPNVVLEAKSCGLPVLVSARGGSGQVSGAEAEGGVQVDSDDPAEWAQVIALLAGDPARRRVLGASARADVERRWPSWREVLTEDVLPVWREVIGAGRRARGRTSP